MKRLQTVDERRAVSRGQIFAWTLFDFANTGFSVMIVTLGYALYFRQVVAGSDRYWGIAVSLSMLICALLAPPLGAIADATRGRKRFLLGFTLLSVLATAALYWVEAGMIFWGITLFVIANVGFESGIVFYDALLPSLAPPTATGRVSGYGYAMGYFGSLAILALCFPLIQGGVIPENLDKFRLAFPITAAFFFVFALPLFLFVREPLSTVRPSSSFKQVVRSGFQRAWRTLRTLPRFPNLSRFLLAFFFYNDAILTVISFSAIFAQTTLGFSTKEVVVFFLVVQTAAILGSVLFGILTDKYGPKRTILLSLLLWFVVVAVVFTVVSKWGFWAAGLLAGGAIGGTQSASRSLMVLLTPKERAAEFFGFFDGFFGKASAILGPVVFGVLSDVLNQRLAILSLAVFFLAGALLLAGVRETVEATAP